MGRKQRDSGFIGIGDDELAQIARNPNTDPDTRERAIREEKSRIQRNVQKRRSRQRNSPRKRNR